MSTDFTDDHHPKPAPCGSWPSPITEDSITKGTVGLGFVAATADATYWTESRPWDQGRSVLVRHSQESGAKDISAPDHTVRSRVHEYGGRAFAAAGDTAWYLNATDRRIYRVVKDGAPEPMTAEDGTEYADFLPDPARSRLIAVAERARPDREAVNLLVAIGDDGRVTPLAEGADFYAAPRLSPDGRKLAWIEWYHPNMPWDGTLCREAQLDANGHPADIRTVAGSPEISVFQPEYAPDGRLYFVSDESGFWNLYRDGESPDHTPAHYKAQAEFGLPHWQFGMRTYGFLDAQTAVVTFAIAGEWQLALFHLETGKATPIDLPWCRFDGLITTGNRVLFCGARPDGPSAIVQLTFGGMEPEQILRSASDLDIPDASISKPQAIQFPTEQGEDAHAFFYPPANANYCPREGERPPLIVMGHGGPTGQADPGYSAKVQFWTTRGFAVADVNYGGSTGYGRAYRRRLLGQWGIVDVDDCCNAARYLVAQDAVDPDRLVIVGGSAGGYTTLSALAFRSVFKAGRSSYGIGDLETLARDTHKFESRYLDSLIGPWPEAKEIYHARSPLRHTEGLDCPILFLQGSEDKVVPPNQAESMVQVLKEKGLPVAYLLFEGEGHGFRGAAAVQAALQAELSFYGQIFDFEPAGDISPIEITNLKS
jgi:dipeptidyl aminopeptidase/acylaminoacyl peptidase